MKKAAKRTIQERVDVLIKEGVEGISKWAIRHTYTEPEAVVGGDAWSDEWQKLRKHHLEEIGFFLEVIGELRKRIVESDGRDRRDPDDSGR